MKKTIGFIGLLALFAALFAVWPAQSQTINGTYQVGTGTASPVNSTTVPVSVLTPGTYAGWFCDTKSTAAAVADCFVYSGTLPGAAPSNFNFFISPGGGVADNQVQTIKLLPNYGIGCVLDSGNTSVLVACTGRTG